MKKLLVLFLALLLLVCFAACEDPQDVNTKPGEQPGTTQHAEHIHSFTQTVTDPSCTESGFTTYTCACGYSYLDNYVNPKNHSFTEQVTPATCTEAGYTTHICACGYSYTDSETAALGHIWSAWTATKEATEEEMGEEERSCASCAKKEHGYTPKLEHTHKYTETVVAPTCTEKGYTAHTCSCGEHYEDAETSATGHSWSAWVTIQAATEEAPGLEERSCTVCAKTETQEISKLDHIHSYTAKVTEPTCTKQGYTTYTCSCGDSYKDNFVEGSHSLDGYLCTKCNTLFVDQAWTDLAQWIQANGKAGSSGYYCSDTQDGFLYSIEYIPDEERIQCICTGVGEDKEQYVIFLYYNVRNAPFGVWYLDYFAEGRLDIPTYSKDTQLTANSYTCPDELLDSLMNLSKAGNNMMLAWLDMYLEQNNAHISVYDLGFIKF